MVREICLATLLAYGCFGSSAWAADVISAVTTGGLELSDSRDLVVDAERLTVSPFHIHIEYTLRNTGSADVIKEAIFRLPPYDRKPLEAERALDGANTGNPLGLKVMVEGKTQTLKVERNMKLKIEGMMAPVQVTRSWSQIFPPNKAVNISLDYDSASGANYSYPIETTDAAGFCMGETTRKAINDKTGEKQFQAELSLEFPPEALPTTPIAHFSLRLIKVAPNDMLSLCFPGDLSKASATSFVAERDNFTPPSKMRVMFLTSNNPEEASRHSR